VPEFHQDARTAPPASGCAAATLVCEGCGGRVAVPHEPTADLIEGVQVFVAAHARCDQGRGGYRIELSLGSAA
jgi:hypothetical protein